MRRVDEEGISARIDLNRNSGNVHLIPYRLLHTLLLPLPYLLYFALDFCHHTSTTPLTLPPLPPTPPLSSSRVISAVQVGEFLESGSPRVQRQIVKFHVFIFAERGSQGGETAGQAAGALELEAERAVVGALRPQSRYAILQHVLKGHVEEGGRIEGQMGVGGGGGRVWVERGFGHRVGRGVGGIVIESVHSRIRVLRPTK